MTTLPKQQEIQDKENTAYGLPLKKDKSFIEEPPKKIALAESSQPKAIDWNQEEPSSPLGTKLLNRKREMQKERNSQPLKLEVRPC